MKRERSFLRRLWRASGSALRALLKAIVQLDYGRVYGKTGAVIALLVWVYTSSLIMLYGAHFTAQLHQSGD
jgi:uncharacterized BrkB/YihY/UPF0761 family membrane protein